MNNNIAGKPKTLKEVNKTLILQCIKEKQTATRAEITEATKISHTTVRSILKELLKCEDIVIVGLDKSSGGRRAERYKINADKTCIIAATVEAEKLTYRVVNAVGEILEDRSQKLKSKEDIDSIYNTFNRVIDKYKNIKCIGINVPGIVTERGYVSGLGVDDWKEVYLKEELISKYNIPVVLENDLNSVAVGYYKNNTDSGSIIYISFTSLGAGAGIIVNGKLYKGANGSAGEVGVLPIGDTYLNNILLRNLDNDEYINATVKTIKIIASLLNPKTIVLGGNYFRYNLAIPIINRYKNEFNIKTNIIVDKNGSDYGLLGITEIALQKINKQVKLVNK
ncbi:ROK family transcriptional regulator [Clostridium lundense]|uniref:ROK family transcriptional regulator n=1 Tax=Clostridium lundense TaxID=319475 RepID=UPI000484B604|nr:ROK family protein [Clostridium lundense]